MLDTAEASTCAATGIQMVGICLFSLTGQEETTWSDIFKNTQRRKMAQLKRTTTWISTVLSCSSVKSQKQPHIHPQTSAGASTQPATHLQCVQKAMEEAMKAETASTPSDTSRVKQTKGTRPGCDGNKGVPDNNLRD